MIRSLHGRKGTTGRLRWAEAAFTLIELMVSIAILMVIMVVLANISDQVSRVWTRFAGQSQISQEGRAAMDAVTRDLRQATLNPYWTYDSPANPTRYMRKSDLAFVSGDATQLLGSTGNTTGTAVFFQAMLGRSDAAANSQLKELLNTVGFFLWRGTDPKAPTGTPAATEPKWRLMKLQSPAERMQVFTKNLASNPTDYSWFSNLLTGGAVHQVAENIVLFRILPLKVNASGEVTTFPSGAEYNSAVGALSNPQPETANQLPPIAEITMIVTDDASARRLASITTVDWNADLTEIENQLSGLGLNFRIMVSRVQLPNSKWNG